MEFIPTEVILKRAKAAASCPALRDTEAKNRALAAMAQALRTGRPRPFWRKTPPISRPRAARSRTLCSTASR